MDREAVEQVSAMGSMGDDAVVNVGAVSNEVGGG